MIVVDAADMKVTRKYTFVERDLTSLLPLGYVPAPAFADGRKPTGGKHDEDLGPQILRKGVESVFCPSSRLWRIYDFKATVSVGLIAAPMKSKERI